MCWALASRSTTSKWELSQSPFKTSGPFQTKWVRSSHPEKTGRLHDSVSFVGGTGGGWFWRLGGGGSALFTNSADWCKETSIFLSVNFFFFRRRRRRKKLFKVVYKTSFVVKSTPQNFKACGCERSALGGWTVTPGDQRRAENKQKMKVEAVCVFIHPATAALLVKKKKKQISEIIRNFHSRIFIFFFNLQRLLHNSAIIPTVCGRPTSSINRHEVSSPRPNEH